MYTEHYDNGDMMYPDQADILRARYYSGKTLQAIADDGGANREHVRQLEAKALRHMRKPGNSRQLKPFLYESANCHGYGLTSYRERGFVSKVEVLAGVW